ncbi:MAG: hypothetical protein AB8D52_06700 [Gammaproteobacteria bacterium]
METGSGGDLNGMLAQAQAQMQQSLAAQTQMQQQSQEFNMKSTISKMQFDTMQSAIERLASVGQSVSRLTDQQSQQLAG